MNTSMESVSGETSEIGTADEGKVEGTLRRAGTEKYTCE